MICIFVMMGNVLVWETLRRACLVSNSFLYTAIETLKSEIDCVVVTKPVWIFAKTNKYCNF